jgi:hypothetical protein
MKWNDLQNIQVYFDTDFNGSGTKFKFRKIHFLTLSEINRTLHFYPDKRNRQYKNQW